MNFKTIIITAPLLASLASSQELVELTASDAGARDNFGQSVAIDGGILVIGAGQDDASGLDSGSAYAFVGTGSTWTEESKLVALDGVNSDFFGSSASLSNSTAVLGAPGDDHVNGSNNDEGAAYVFVRSGSSWAQEAKIISPSAAAGDAFGLTVAVDGDTLVVGSPFDDGAGADAGIADVYVRSGSTWTHQAELSPSDSAGGDLFGYSLAVDGDTVVIGSFRDDDTAANSGSAYVFVRSGSTWSEEAKLTAFDAAGGDAFGRAVTLQADTAVIGAFQDDDGGLNSGSAYVFTRSGATWTQQSKLSASDASALDAFGRALSLDSGRLVIGAHGDSSTGSSSGAAYVFEGAGSSWSETSKLEASEAASADFFGASVGLSDGIAAVASAWDDDDGLNSGSVTLSWVPVSAPTFCTSKATSIAGCIPSASAPSSMASLSGGAGSFDLTCGPIPGGNNAGIYIYSRNALSKSPPSTPFGSLCLSGFFRGVLAFGGGGMGNCDGLLTWDLGAQLGSLVTVGAGDVVSVQCWYRDPPVAPAGANFSDGVRFLVIP